MKSIKEQKESNRSEYGGSSDSLWILIFSEVQLHNWFLQSQSDEENDFILGWAESSQFFQYLCSRESE